MAMIDRSRQAFRVSRPKPTGGYCIVNSHTLLSVWLAYRQEIIELLDLRVWFACLELLARRCGARKGRVPRYSLIEIQQLVGSGTQRRIRGSLHRLERAGLVRWHETLPWVAQKAKECAS